MLPRDPTQEEIAERCASIREEWDAETETRRAGAYAPTGWTPPRGKSAIEEPEAEAA